MTERNNTMNIHPLSILALMLLAHLVADYTLQGCLAQLKQKAWWMAQMNDVKPTKRAKYKHDYIVALICHSLYWSLIVCFPLVEANSPLYATMSFAQAVVHFVIDDAKANRGLLNLVQDQVLHGLQILSVWGAWLMF